MSARFDAIVIGAGAEGLAAAALLARAGRTTLLLERSAILFGATGEASLRALDPKVAKALRLARHGLGFAARDLSLSMPGGATVTRDRHATARSLAALSASDAAAFEDARRALATLARALRPLWWEDAEPGAVTAALKPAQRDLFERLKVTSANAWLASRFESEPLRAALAFDAAAVGAAPSEAGSALALAWCAAQEMSGLQGAVALPRGGVAGVLRALSEAAQKAGATVRSAAAVRRIDMAGGAVAGVTLDGETIAAPLVLSTLSRRRTLGELLPPGEIGLGAARTLLRAPPSFGTATLVYSLNRIPDLGFLRGPGATRFVLAERPDAFETALAAVRLGRMAAEPALELILPPPEPSAAALGGRLQLTVRAWPVAETLDDKALEACVTRLIERRAPGFAAVIAGCELLPPAAGMTAPSRLLASARSRIATPVRGLFLCGPDAEPAAAVSTRAARLAAQFALAQHKRVAP